MVRKKIKGIWESNSASCGVVDKLQSKITETSMYLHVETKSRIVRSKEKEMQLRRSTRAAQRLYRKIIGAIVQGGSLRLPKKHCNT